jgi:hypothetical protein
MIATPVKALLRAGFVCAFCACAAGCAAPRTSTPMTDAAAPSPIGVISDRAPDAVAIGNTKADVMAVLGKATVIGFDSGFEVWVYRLQDRDEAASRKNGVTGLSAPKEPAREVAAKGEFIVLFSRSGVVAKTRIRKANGAAA